MSRNINKCPACFSIENQKYSHDKYRNYFICSSCDLVFVSRNEILSSAEEKKRYDQHENHADGEYLSYLSNIASTILPYLKKENAGLDFGCGATTALAQIIGKQGVHVDSFDLYYYPNPGIWNKAYDFIILSEVIEHLHHPFETMEALLKILNVQGKIFIKTKFRDETVDFSNWYYKRDITHIQFFNKKSMSTFANKFDYEVIDIGNDLYLWNK